MGLNHLQSLICTYSADDLGPLMKVPALKDFWDSPQLGKGGISYLSVIEF